MPMGGPATPLAPSLGHEHRRDTTLLGPPRPLHARGPRLGHVRLGQLGHGHPDRDRGLSDLLQVGLGGRAPGCHGDLSLRHGDDARAHRERGPLPAPRHRRRLQRLARSATSAWFLALGVASTAFMFFLQQGGWLWALVLFMLANIGANGSFVFYDALLPARGRAGRNGPALHRGLCAGLSRRRAAAGVLARDDPGAGPLRTAQRRRPHAGAGLAPGANQLPAHRGLVGRLLDSAVPARFPSRPRRRDPRGRVARARSARRSRISRQTLRHLRTYKQAFLLLVAFLIYNDGIGTIIRMATIYGEERHLQPLVMIGAIAAVQFIGIPVLVSLRPACRRTSGPSARSSSGSWCTWGSASWAIS